MPVKVRPKPKNDFWGNLEEVSRRCRRRPIESCEHCWGKGTTVQEVDNGGRWDKMYDDVKCAFCGGKGKTGGGQPGLQLYFQSEAERNEFKAKIVRMRGITWIDEGHTLEAEGKVPWKD